MKAGSIEGRSGSIVGAEDSDVERFNIGVQAKVILSDVANGDGIRLTVSQRVVGGVCWIKRERSVGVEGEALDLGRWVTGSVLQQSTGGVNEEEGRGARGIDVSGRQRSLKE